MPTVGGGDIADGEVGIVCHGLPMRTHAADALRKLTQGDRAVRQTVVSDESFGCCLRRKPITCQDRKIAFLSVDHVPECFSNRAVRARSRCVKVLVRKALAVLDQAQCRPRLETKYLHQRVHGSRSSKTLLLNFVAVEIG